MSPPDNEAQFVNILIYDFYQGYYYYLLPPFLPFFDHGNGPLYSSNHPDRRCSTFSLVKMICTLKGRFEGFFLVLARFGLSPAERKTHPSSSFSSSESHLRFPPLSPASSLKKQVVDRQLKEQVEEKSRAKNKQKKIRRLRESLQRRRSKKKITGIPPPSKQILARVDKLPLLLFREYLFLQRERLKAGDPGKNKRIKIKRRPEH